MLFREWYTYGDIAITDKYVVSPFSEALSTVSTTCMKKSDIVWFYEYDMPIERRYIRRTSVFNSKDKQAITLSDAKKYQYGIIRSLSKRKKHSKDYGIFRDMILEKASKRLLVGQSIENERRYFEIIGEKYIEPPKPSCIQDSEDDYDDDEEF